MYELKRIVESQDSFLDVLFTNKPGKVIYEDDYQIVAIPFKDTIL